jgi:hypothetical protein
VNLTFFPNVKANCFCDIFKKSGLGFSYLFTFGLGFAAIGKWLLNVKGDHVGGDFSDLSGVLYLIAFTYTIRPGKWLFHKDMKNTIARLRRDNATFDWIEMLSKEDKTRLRVMVVEAKANYGEFTDQAITDIAKTICFDVWKKSK